MAWVEGDPNTLSGVIPVTGEWVGAYVGLPFGEGVGQVTCWSLVMRVYAEQLAVLLPAYGEISARDLARVGRAMAHGSAEECWLEINEPDEFDVVLMRSARGRQAIVHVGVMVDATRILHAEEATDTVVVPIDHYSVSGRIAGYRRYKG